VANFFRATHYVLAAMLLSATPGIAEEKEKESATLKIISVKVRPTKPGGGAWDVGNGAPDLKISLQRQARPAGEKFVTKVAPDTLEAKFNVRTIKVKVGDTIDVQVLDEDQALHDTIGKVEKKITAAMLRKGEDEWSFGEVLSLKVEFVD